MGKGFGMARYRYLVCRAAAQNQVVAFTRQSILDPVLLTKLEHVAVEFGWLADTG
jgi:hypothetical protein